MKLDQDKIVDTISNMLKGMPEVQMHTMINSFIDCYECLHHLFGGAQYASIYDQVSDTFYILAIRTADKYLFESCTQLTEEFLRHLDDVNALEWALDVIKNNRT